jgi:hypothetical protein
MGNRQSPEGDARRLSLSLYNDDMRRMGDILADLFCQALSGGDRYFEKDAAAGIEERAA